MKAEMMADLRNYIPGDSSDSVKSFSSLSPNHEICRVDFLKMFGLPGGF